VVSGAAMPFTTMTLAWMAERLHIGVPGHEVCLLCHANQQARGSGSKLYWPGHAIRLRRREE
jgi:hypothetical protein